MVTQDSLYLIRIYHMISFFLLVQYLGEKRISELHYCIVYSSFKYKKYSLEHNNELKESVFELDRD